MLLIDTFPVELFYFKRNLGLYFNIKKTLICAPCTFLGVIPTLSCIILLFLQLLSFSECEKKKSTLGKKNFQLSKSYTETQREDKLI